MAKINQSARFNKGYEMTELLAAALAKLDLPFVLPRYRSSYFQYIWDGGYAAGYYAYLWTQTLTDDAYAAFTEQGGFTAANGRRFRALILSRGNSQDLEQLYRDWRDKDPAIGAMLRHRGLADD